MTPGCHSPHYSPDRAQGYRDASRVTHIKAGSVRLRVSKDRNGGVGAVGAIIAMCISPREKPKTAM